MSDIAQRTAQDILSDAFDEFDWLDGIEAFRGMPEIEKKMYMLHLARPDVTKWAIAKAVKIPIRQVYDFFNSEKWKALNLIVAKQQILELVPLAIRTLKTTMIKEKNGAVKLEAVIKVLANADVIKDRIGKVTQTDNRMVVVWGKDATNNSLPASLEATRSSQLDG